MTTKHIICLLLCGAALLACGKDIVSVAMRFNQPTHFPAPDYHFSSNQITQAKFELGRKLFYEPRLSRDNSISCGSCHIQSAGFTQHGHDLSHGIDDRLGTRNSPPIVNLAWRKTFFWDGGVFDLDLQPIVPITNPVEMDESVDNVLKKLREQQDYPRLFQNAFGTDEINTERMMKALSQFMLMLVSADAKYDKVTRKDGAVFTASEKEGYVLFQQKCGSCHAEPLFTDDSFRNNGIAIGSNNDLGRYAVTLQDSDRYKFKVPTLRNLSFTAPYMHDGRFLTLDAVLEQYNQHVQQTPNLDPLLSQNNIPGIAMTADEKSNLLAFLKTLDDPAFIADKRFSEQ